ncbi:serine/threonine protein kinase [Allorhodopirellula solitaria]|uniref:non-specific serine/threonine protein kinase n=1 Tax=Allorhodopirellula solitaria TaxID=2527987 RepID=A0A5C5YCZ9_9BACT|nr:serine/threonine-protein kinase [Allorhodopirellula solitaria]TWT73250.1 Serine/threonine-protein kinase PknB [Allorhodopirellula solitaria]
MSESSIADAIQSPAIATYPAAAVTPSASQVPGPRRTSTLGDYELHREVGRGGMGIVYEATQISLRRSVAIKTLPFASVLDQQQVARFRNEAQAAASLHHPHIVPVYAVGCERGVHYYSMQLIDGDTLEQTLASLQANEAQRKRAEKLSELRREEAQQAAAELTAEMPFDDTDAARLTGAPEFAEQPFASVVKDQATSRAVKDHGSTVRSMSDRRGIHTIVRLFIDVADALDYAHEQGVIHRDVKPSNLLIDAEGKVWVADFGLARCRGAGNLTADGSALGTARYMSPEQIAGRPQAVDHRTDIYSLGITLYEMLTLEPAFSADSRDQLLRAVETQQPTSPRRLNSKIETDLETIVLKAIAKSKDDRYATAGDLADDLRRYLDGLPTMARRPGRVDLAFRWVVRHRKIVLTSLFLLAVAFIGSTVSTMLVAKQSREAQRQAHIARAHLSEAFNLIDGFNGMAVEKLPNLPGGKPVLRSMLTNTQHFVRRFIHYSEAEPQFAVQSAKLQFVLGSIADRLEDRELAEAKYELALAQFTALEPLHRENSTFMADYAVCLHCLANMRKQNGRYQDAGELYTKASRVQQQAIAMPVESQSSEAQFLRSQSMMRRWALTQSNFAKLQFECGETTPAIERMRQTNAELEQFIQSNLAGSNLRSAMIECRNTLAGLIRHSAPTEAEELFRDNLADLADSRLDSVLSRSWSLSVGGNSRDGFDSLSPQCQRAVAQNNLANLLAQRQQWSEACELTLGSIEALESYLDEHPIDRDVQQHLAVAHNNHGQILFSGASEGDTADAEAAFSRAQVLFQKLVAAGGDDPQLLSRFGGVLHNLSVLRQRRGDLQSAVGDLTDAIEMQTLAVGKAPRDVGYRKLLELHSELLEQLLRQLDQSPHSAEHAEQVTQRRLGLEIDT